MGVVLQLGALIPVLLLGAVLGLYGVLSLGGTPTLAVLASPLLTTLTVVALALLIAVPVGLVAATYLSELASPREQRLLRPLLVFFASVPGVAFGWVALTITGPVARTWDHGDPLPSMAPAVVVMGMMLVPLVCALAEEALAAVPRALREAGWALGLSDLEVIRRVVWPAAARGLWAVVLFAGARAAGETMVVLMALAGRRTLTTSIVARDGSLAHDVSRFGVPLIVLTSVLGVVAHHWMRRVRSWA